ncbi:MAG: Fe-S cluster assembly protein SufD [Thermoanaerobaculales bacterium]|nr:Fe-S cluster assembly protein SufD [Thermoanaerobaculales bacterium]
MSGAEVATAGTPFARALEAAAAAPAPAALQRLRSAGRARFAAAGLPDRRQEAWRFTRLRALEGLDFEPPPAAIPRIDVDRWRRPGSPLLVFVDGRFSPELSSPGELADGVVLTNLPLAAATGSAVVEAHLGRLAALDRHPFAALGTALLADGAVLWVPERTAVAAPVQLLFLSTASPAPTVCAPRLLVVADAGSRLSFEEHHVGSGPAVLACPVSEIVLGPDAAVEHVVVQEVSEAASLVALRHVELAAGSRYSSQAISLGGALARTDIEVVLAGERAEAALDGLSLTDGEQQAESHVLVRHARPHGSSTQLYKSVLGGASRSVFNGRIVVDPGAQKTDARQSNRNLVLSDAAVANSNPQLEIFADDVRCTHGSTVGRLDDEALFYLRSRGLDRTEAQAMLVRAFAGEILDRIREPEPRERVAALVAGKLAALTTAGGAP